MKPKKSKFLKILKIARGYLSEPKVMKELHKIREEMSKMPKEDFHKGLKKHPKNLRV